jgi:uncharacterized protein (DUF3820 family)
MKETIIKGIKFNSKKEVFAYAKEIMKKYVNTTISGDDLDFMWELIIMNYPNPEVKNLYCANKICVKPSHVYGQDSLWVWVIDNSGNEHDVSLHKSIDNLKWEEIEIENDYLYFGKYKGKTVSEVIKFDLEYLQWLLEQNWLNEGLRKSIVTEQEKFLNSK